MRIFIILLLLFVISMGFIFRIKVDPFDEKLFSLLKEKYYKKFYILCNFRSLREDLEKDKILIRKLSFSPWTLYLSWEREHTLIYIKTEKEEKFINQKGELMSDYKPVKNTIRVNNVARKSLKEIVKLIDSLSKAIDIKEIILKSKYFEVKTSSGSMLMGYENIEEKFKTLKYILLVLDKKYFIDLRFKIPVIKGL
ncbi:MAG: hypothetical protein NZ841_04005 [Dictyoglomus sp.]|nr:hypothetical protein [Dictyoglomus sp.]MCX7942355.1 hypothetical protein [Dictyoglomaceae bacterium]MDW8188441.1 hypothetical protein [Dictyoglomus sp.]